MTRQITIAMKADTGYQSVLVGIKIIHRLGFKKSDLIPVKTRMSAVNRDAIPILGAFILRQSGKSESGKIKKKAQICYVTDVIEGAYLNREACTILAMIPSDFLGSATQQPMSVSSAAASPRDDECDCSCRIRSEPPSLPTALPFHATDANRAFLQNWILDRYRSSTFNTCECQTLPLMEGPPLELHVPRRRRGQADRSPQTHSSPSTLTTGNESVNRQRCQTRGSGGCPSWRISYLVPSNGHGSEEKRQATTHSGHAGAQQTCCA